MNGVIDLRSDTVTRPTPEMYRAMAEAELGDDVFGDDPTAIKLEALAAEKVGKEAALLVASGTMGNLTAVKTHTKAGHEVLVEARSHVYNYEAGGMSAVAGVLPRPVASERGYIHPDTIAGSVRPSNVHFARLSLLCIENTHNFHGGCYLSPAQMATMFTSAKDHGLNVHLDGARIFNAAVAQGIDVRQLTQQCDSVQFCLSKGLSSPIGSVLAGPADFITEARRVRKMLGGGMRQAGIIAACGIVSLNSMIDRLAEDHANCKWMAARLSELKAVDVDLDLVQTNLLFFNISGSAPEAVQRWKARGLLASAPGPRQIRLAFHKDVSRDATAAAWEILREDLG